MLGRTHQLRKCDWKKGEKETNHLIISFTGEKVCVILLRNPV